MALLHEIQTELLDGSKSLSPILMKVRFLAKKLGSDVLADWVRHEMDGCPEEVEVTQYRRATMSFKGMFTNGHWVVRDKAIPNVLVRALAGDEWVDHQIRLPMSTIDEMSDSEAGGTAYTIDTGNLNALIGDKIFEDMHCIHMKGHFGAGAHSSIRSAVRARLLDFVVELEEQFPEAVEIGVGGNKPADIDAGKVSSLTQNFFYAPVSNITASGVGSTITVTVNKGDTDSLIQHLKSRGFDEVSAEEIAELASNDQPEGPGKPIGKRVLAWLGRKSVEGVKVIGNVGVDLAAKIIAESLKSYYGQ